MTQADLAIPPTLATPARRLSGWLCDCMPFAIAGFVAGIVAGATDSSEATTAVFLALALVYLIWVVVAARQGQTPGKQLLDTYIIREDGSVAGLGYVIVREVIIKGILFGMLAAITLYIGWIFSSLWCTWDANRQCLWDKVVGSRVVYAPHGIGQITSLSYAVGSPSGAPAPAARPAENLQTLQDLHARGLLTDEEYEERRTRELESL